MEKSILVVITLAALLSPFVAKGVDLPDSGALPTSAAQKQHDDQPSKPVQDTSNQAAAGTASKTNPGCAIGGIVGLALSPLFASNAADVGKVMTRFAQGGCAIGRANEADQSTHGKNPAVNSDDSGQAKQYPGPESKGGESQAVPGTGPVQ